MNRALPEEKYESIKCSTVVLPYIITLVFLILLNVITFFFLDYAQPNKGYVLIEEKWDLLAEQTDPVDVLILGDSSCNQGIDPKVIQNNSDWTALNLCTIGHMLVAQDAWMADDYLSRVGTPKHIVIGHVYDVWPLSDDALKTLVARVSTSGAYFDSLVPPLDVSTPYLLTQRYLPIYSQKKTTVSYLTDPRRLLKRQQFHFDPDGFMPELNADPKRVKSDLAQHLKFVRDRFEMESVEKPEPAYKMTKINEDAIDRLVRLSEQFPDTQFHIVASPIHENLKADAVWKRYYAEVETDLRKKFKRSRVNLHLDPFAVAEPLLQNADHVTTKGAHEYTLHVLSLIRTAKH